MNLLGNILYDTVYHSTPIILCVIGGMFAYKANVLNIALEGMMLNGAFVAALAMFLTGNLPIAILLAVASTLLYGFIFSFLGITCHGNVIIVGLAINLVSSAIAGFVLVMIGSANINLTGISTAAFQIHIPIIENIPFIGRVLSGHPPITYLSFLGIGILYVLMYRTKFGVYVRVVGENEDAARSLGIKTSWYKYAAVLIGALCCAFAGINMSVERLGLFTNDMTAGRGFIAIAAIYCGQGRPVPSALYAVLFGVARALSVNLSIYAGPASGLFDTIPYLIMVAVLAAASVIKHKNGKMRGYMAD